VISRPFFLFTAALYMQADSQCREILSPVQQRLKFLDKPQETPAFSRIPVVLSIRLFTLMHIVCDS
jgi:hypothetical protein